MIPQYARYEYCIKKSIEFILNENINKFPFNSDDIISKHKWSRLKYSYLASINNCTIDDISEAYESNDGYTIYSGRNYTISYNDCHDSKRRIYFTKLHEIGHIYLNHFLEFNETIIKRSSMTDAEYKVLENEANCFARNVIAPAVIVKQLKLDTPEKISDYFEITHRAAKTRLDLLEYDLRYIDKKDEDNLLNLFKPYMYKNYCFNCGHSINIPNANYCPICGQTTIAYGNGYSKYSGIELTEEIKDTICSNCHINLKDCKNCRPFISNKCINVFCQISLDSNARYCHQCHSFSSFFYNNLLVDWSVDSQNYKDFINSQESQYEFF